MEHKHILINATFESSPFRSAVNTERWIRSLVEKIDMEVLYPPKAVYCDKKGNEGLTAFCIITTSHIALHSWETRDPNLVQLDIYSCKNFSIDLVLSEIDKLNPITVGHKYIDRSINATKGWRRVE